MLKLEMVYMPECKLHHSIYKLLPRWDSEKLYDHNNKSAWSIILTLVAVCAYNYTCMYYNGLELTGGRGIASTPKPLLIS